MATSESLTVSAIVAAGQGCGHARGVLVALRQQLGTNDELIVLEPDECQQGHPENTRETHLVASPPDDFSMRVQGLAASSGVIALALEDHGIPGPDFIRALKRLFASNPGLQGAHFFFTNGTKQGVASRALYYFVGAIADRELAWPSPALVASSFALSGPALDEARQRAQGGQLPGGELEHDICPMITNSGLKSLPKELTIFHFQSNTLAEAMLAVYWNARFAGWHERKSCSSVGALAFSIRRYLGRSTSLLLKHPSTRSTGPQLFALSASGGLGWWVGRYLGPGDNHTGIARAHPIPSPDSLGDSPGSGQPTL